MTYVGFPAVSQRLHQALARCLLQPTFAARIANAGPVNELCPVCVSAPVQVVAFNANLFPIIVPRLVAMHYTRTTPSSSIRPLQSPACGCSPRPVPEPATGQTGGAGEPKGRIGIGPRVRGEVGAHEGHQGLLSVFLGSLDRPLSVPDHPSFPRSQVHRQRHARLAVVEDADIFAGRGKPSAYFHAPRMATMPTRCQTRHCSKVSAKTWERKP